MGRRAPVDPRTQISILAKVRFVLLLALSAVVGAMITARGGPQVGDLLVLILATLSFFWTPIHFGALAYVYRDDYLRDGVLVLPVVTMAHRSARLRRDLESVADPTSQRAWQLFHASNLFLVAACIATLLP